METSAPGSPYLHKQVHHDDKGLITITIPKYNPMNDCSENALLCSEVTIVTHTQSKAQHQGKFNMNHMCDT
jgi:hypothetical protein